MRRQAAISATDVQGAINELDSEKLALAGGTMSGAIAMGASKITGMADPTLAQDAATMNYVDTQDATLITEVGTASGSGLSGGATSGTANLQVVVDDSSVEIATNTIQVKDGGITNAKLASGIDAAKITTGTLPTARIDTGTGANQIVQLDGSSRLPAVDGSLLTNVVGTDNTKLPLAGGSLTGNLNLEAESEVRFEDNTGGEYVGFKAPATVTSSYAVSLPPAAGATNQILKLNASGDLVWTNDVDTNTGEVNTASNQGTAGVGVYDNKNGDDLEFRNINAGSSKVSVSLDAGNKEVDVDIVEANIDHDALRQLRGQ